MASSVTNTSFLAVAVVLMVSYGGIVAGPQPGGGAGGGASPEKKFAPPTKNWLL